MRKAIEKGFKYLFLCFVALIVNQKLTAKTLDEEVQVADDVHLTGLLGTKIRIDMVLRLETGRYFFNNSGAKSFEVRGKYYYRTQLKPIYVGGTLSPSQGLLLLTVGDEENPNERFEGKWDLKLKKVAGNWTLIKNAPIKASHSGCCALGATVRKMPRLRYATRGMT